MLSPLLRCFKLHEKKTYIFVGKKNGKMENKGKKNHWAIVWFWVKTCIAKKNEMLCWSQVNKISKRVNIYFVWLQTIQLIHDIFAMFTSRNLNHLGYTLGTWPLLVCKQYFCDIISIKSLCPIYIVQMHFIVTFEAIFSIHFISRMVSLCCQQQQQ